MTAPPTAAALAAREPRLDAFLFWGQILCALAFGATQLRALHHSIAGASVSWIGLWLAFLLVNLSLALEARRRQPGRAIQQTVQIYTVWSAVCAVVLIYLLLRGAQWYPMDSLTAALTAVGVGVSLLYGKLSGRGIQDPYVRAGFAVFFKGVPQLTLAWHILGHGGEGIAAFAFIAGHITINMRLWQVWRAIREAGWDRHRGGIAIGEAANEVSWVIATVAWLSV